MPDCSPPHAETADTLAQFESLGDNCEFGFVQRHFGMERLGLFRFNWISMEALLRGLDTEFAGLDEPSNLFVESDQGGEFIIKDRLFGFYTHTGRYQGQVEPEELKRTESARLAFLRRKLFEDLTSAEKIFVRKGEGPSGQAEIARLHDKLRMFGPNTLLWVTPATETMPAGNVHRIGDGLLKAYITRFAPYGFARNFLPDEWAEICANAVRLHGPH
jgi:hypothetical protein